MKEAQKVEVLGFMIRPKNGFENHLLMASHAVFYVTWLYVFNSSKLKLLVPLLQEGKVCALTLVYLFQYVSDSAAKLSASISLLRGFARNVQNENK